MEHFSWSESQIAFRGDGIKENACNCTQDPFLFSSFGRGSFSEPTTFEDTSILTIEDAHQKIDNGSFLCQRWRQMLLILSMSCHYRHPISSVSRLALSKHPPWSLLK